MADQNCDILFSYLRSILYDDRVQRPDLNSLDPSFAKLGQGMMYLEEAVSEMKKNTASLSKGELSEFPQSGTSHMAGSSGCPWRLFSESLLSW